MERMDRYLRPTPTIDCDTESVKEKAQNLTKGQEEVIEKAKSLFYFVRDEIKYNPYVLIDRIEYYRASRILDIGEGFCIQKAVLLAALTRAVGIPARLRFADIRNHLLPDKLRELAGTNLLLHGYNDLYIEGKWTKSTPTFDLKTCQENRIIPVEFDGKRDATFHSHNLDGKLHIEYVQDHGHYDELPFDKITNLGLQAFDADFLERMREEIEAQKA